MYNIKKVLAICGSTRANSANLNLIHAIKEIASGKIIITIYNKLSELPHFNPDDDTKNVSPIVSDFRNQVHAADGVLICTPEYAMGLPGSLKNAIDWTVSSCEFSHKPVAAITASSVGEKAHESLIGTLKVIEAKINNDTQLLIPFVKTKINSSIKITDPKTQVEIEKLIDAFLATMQSTEKTNS